MRRSWRWLVRMVAGHDIFISYGRRGGGVYARTVAAELASLGFDAFFDEHGTDPGIRVPPPVLRKARRSSLLVLISTSGATTSESIEEELRVFLSAGPGQCVIPIDVDGTIERAIWYGLIRGIPVTSDAFRADSSLDRVPPGNASPALTRIEQSFVRVKRAAGLRRLLVTVGVVVGLSVVASVVLWRTAVESRAAADSAEQQRRESTRAQAAAESATASALAQQRDAEQARDGALAALRAAEGGRLAAERTRAQAERQAAQATENAEMATMAATQAREGARQAEAESRAAIGEGMWSRFDLRDGALGDDERNAVWELSLFGTPLKQAFADALIADARRGVRIGGAPALVLRVAAAGLDETRVAEIRKELLKYLGTARESDDVAALANVFAQLPYTVEDRDLLATTKVLVTRGDGKRATAAGIRALIDRAGPAQVSEVFTLALSIAGERPEVPKQAAYIALEAVSRRLSPAELRSGLDTLTQILAYRSLIDQDAEKAEPARADFGGLLAAVESIVAAMSSVDLSSEQVTKHLIGVAGYTKESLFVNLSEQLRLAAGPSSSSGEASMPFVRNLTRPQNMTLTQGLGALAGRRQRFLFQAVAAVIARTADRLGKAEANEMLPVLLREVNGPSHEPYPPAAAHAVRALAATATPTDAAKWFPQVISGIGEVTDAARLEELAAAAEALALRLEPRVAEAQLSSLLERLSVSDVASRQRAFARAAGPLVRVASSMAIRTNLGRSLARFDQLGVFNQAVTADPRHPLAWTMAILADRLSATEAESGLSRLLPTLTKPTYPPADAENTVIGDAAAMLAARVSLPYAERAVAEVLQVFKVRTAETSLAAQSAPAAGAQVASTSAGIPSAPTNLRIISVPELPPDLAALSRALEALVGVLSSTPLGQGDPSARLTVVADDIVAVMSGISEPLLFEQVALALRHVAGTLAQQASQTVATRTITMLRATGRERSAAPLPAMRTLTRLGPQLTETDRTLAMDAVRAALAWSTDPAVSLATAEAYVALTRGLPPTVLSRVLRYPFLSEQAVVVLKRALNERTSQGPASGPPASQALDVSADSLDRLPPACPAPLYEPLVCPLPR